MQPRPDPLGPDARILPRFRDHELEAQQAKILALVLLETGEPLPRGQRGKLIGFRSAEDDLRRLRALPAIAPGVSGAIPGTDPVRALLAKEGRRRRS